jgi:hypothetical protein
MSSPIINGMKSRKDCIRSARGNLGPVAGHRHLWRHSVIRLPGALASLVAVVAVALALASAATATADTPFLWPAAGQLDGAETTLNAVSCVSSSFCLAGDEAGDVLASTDPSTSSPWSSNHVDGTNSISAVSCTSIELCVAVDDAGDVLSSTEPTAPSPNWMIKNHDLSGPIDDVSCVADTFCVAVDRVGGELTSTEPANPASWPTPTKIDKNPRAGTDYNSIWSVSCVSESLCVAVDSAGNVLTSTNPVAKPAKWHIKSVEGNAIYDVSCASASLCVAVDAGGNILSSTNPGASSPTWTATYHVDTHQLYGISCVQTSTCVAVDSAGNVVSSTDPTGGASAWTVTSVDSEQLNGVSCVSLSLCVAVDSAGDGVIGEPAPPEALSVMLAGEGSGAVAGPEIDCPGSCSHSYPNGTSVSLTATPAAGSTFAGWGGACSGTSACAVTLGSGESVTATFTTRPSGSSSTGSASSTPVKTVNLTVAGAIVSLPGGGIGLPMHCWAKTGDCAPATLSLTAVEKLRGRKLIAIEASRQRGISRRTVTLGSATATLAAGESRTVDIHLNPAAGKLLAQRRSTQALLQIISPQGQTLWKQTVTIAARAQHKRGRS